jgi:hypothetical protein
MSKEKEQVVEEATEVKFELKELKNYQIVILSEVFGKLYKLDFDKDEIDDAIIIADETVILEDAIRSYAKLEKAIYEKVDKSRNKDGVADINVVNKANIDLNELAGKTTKLSSPLSDTVKKYIKKIDKIKPQQLKELRSLGLY